MILYGQTSSGKTFTLFGDKPSKPKFGTRAFSQSEDIYDNLGKSIKRKKDKSTNSQKKSVTFRGGKRRKKGSKNLQKRKYEEKRLKEKKNSKFGIIPRYLESLFEEIEKITKKDDVEFIFEYSFFEIYREKIYDLLNQTYDHVNDENGNTKKVLKYLNLREKSNNQVLIGKV